MTEMLDIYNGAGQHIGIKARDAVHRDGDWHKAFHLWVVSEDGTLILQQRSEQKAAWPGRVDVTAAGHYLAGEQLVDGLREVEEEIGLKTDLSALIPLGMRVCVDHLQPGKINHEFQDVFLLIDNRPLSEYQMQPEELSGLLRAHISDLLRLLSGEVDAVTCEGIDVQKQPKLFTLTRDSFVPSLDNYNLKVVILAQRALKGDAYLAI